MSSGTVRLLRVVVPEFLGDDGQRSHGSRLEAVLLRGQPGRQDDGLSPLRRLVQLLLHDRQRDLVGLEQVGHGDHLARVAALTIAIICGIVVACVGPLAHVTSLRSKEGKGV